MDLLTNNYRSGLIIVPDVEPDREQNSITVRLPIDVDDLRGRPAVSLNVTLEQSPDGSLWWPIGGFSVLDMLETMERRDKWGNPITELWARFTEQIYRADIYRDQQFERWGGYSHELRESDGNGHYYQMAFSNRLRIAIDSFNLNGRGERGADARLGYALNAEIIKRAAPPPPVGRRSASLLGTFAAAESAGTSATSGSRTSTTGSLITGNGGGWNTSSGNNLTITDNKSNSFTEHANAQREFSSGAGSFGTIVCSYNIGGTRGASHTITNTSAFAGATAGGQEWDGIEASPTVACANTTGNSSTPTHSVAVSAASLVLFLWGYDGSATTCGVDDGTQALEIDENNDRQACIVHYKVAQTGTPSVTGSMTGTRNWGAIIITFTESGGAAAASLPSPSLSPALLSILTR